MQAFVQRGTFISQVLQWLGGRWFSAVVDATAFGEWFGISHRRPKNGQIVRIDQFQAS